MTGPGGGAVARRSASARMARLRRPTGDSKPRSARCAGHASVMILRNSIVCCQCSENSSGTSSASPDEILVLGLDHVHESAQIGREVGSLRRRVAGRRRDGRHVTGRVRLCPTLALRPLAHEHCQSNAALDLAHGRRKLELFRPDRHVGGQPRQQRQLLLALGDRTDLRQQHRAPAAGDEEGLLHGARAARRVGSSSVNVGKLDGIGAAPCRARQIAVQDRAATLAETG